VVQGKITLPDPSAERWLKYHGLHITPVPQGWKITVNTTCEMLTDEGLCRIYEHRPKVCRDFFCPAARQRAKLVKGEVRDGKESDGSQGRQEGLGGPEREKKG